jgi:FkbM family methyltransferase
MNHQLIIFDVGANNGKTFLHHALDGHRVYAFEPTPKLISDIKEWLHPKIFPNYNLVEKAVSLENGKTTFNIAGQGDWGCSSILEFSDNLEVTWAGRTDLKVTERIEVETIRLDTFIEQSGNIPYISYLHIDTQGHDLAAMKSLGRYMTIVQAGCVEVPQSKEVQLYKGQHSKEEMIKFLGENGFAIKHIEHQMNEDNIYFERIGSIQ